MLAALGAAGVVGSASVVAGAASARCIGWPW